MREAPEPWAFSCWISRRLNNRAADNWRPLFAIADLAGGAWPHMARQASLALNELDSFPS